jgi:hypothetical protein
VHKNIINKRIYIKLFIFMLIILILFEW